VRRGEGSIDPGGMELVQARLVTADVEASARFFAALVGAEVPLNGYYVEVPAGAASIGFSRCRFTEDRAPGVRCTERVAAVPGEVILDLAVDDVDAAFARVDRLGVTWVLPPATQPWGCRSMLFRGPGGQLVNVFTRTEVTS
jgi:hypothetical protein